MSYISDTRIKLPTVDPLPTLVMDATAQGGAPDTAMFGVNFTGKCYEEWRWRNSNGYLAILTKYHHPAWLNLTGAEQYADARQRVLDVRYHMPQTRILWRHMLHQPPGAPEKTDRGMWKLPYQEYVDNIVLAHGTADLFNVTDCEGHINRSEVKQYAEMQVQVLDYGVPKGARFAVLRMSTHNPLPDVLDSGDLDELLKAIGRNMGHWDDPKVVISNNGYFDDTDNEDGLLTARRIEQRCITKFGFRPIIVMGEYGFDKGFTSVNGWRVSGMNGAQMVGKVIDHAKHIEGMAACVYGVGFSSDAKVNAFHLDNAELELLMKLSPVYAPPGPIVIPVPPKEDDPLMIPPPPVEIAWIEATLKAGTQPNGEPGSIFVRPTPGANEWVALVKDGAPIWYKTEPVKEASSKGVVYKWLYVKTEHGVEGWMALVQPGATPQKPDAQFVPKVVTPQEPETPTETDPDDTQENPSIQFVTKDELANANEAQDEKWARYFADQMAVRDERVKHLQDRVDALERVLRGFGVHIDNELKLVG